MTVDGTVVADAFVYAYPYEYGVRWEYGTRPHTRSSLRAPHTVTLSPPLIMKNASQAQVGIESVHHTALNPPPGAHRTPLGERECGISSSLVSSQAPSSSAPGLATPTGVEASDTLAPGRGSFTAMFM